MLPPEAIQEFKEIYKDDTGEELSDQEALELANRMFNFLKLTYQPITEAAIKELVTTANDCYDKENPQR